MRQQTRCLWCPEEFSIPSDAGVTGVQWRDPGTGAIGPPRPAQSEVVEYPKWAAQGYMPYCVNGHLLPVADTIVVSLFGQTQAGKGALLRSLGNLLKSSELTHRGITAKLREDQYQDWKNLYGPGDQPQTQLATPDHPRQARFFDLNSRTVRKPVNLMIFDTAGEDLEAEDDKTFRQATPFVSGTDVFVFVVPPPCLRDLPEKVKQGGAPLMLQDLDATVQGFHRVVTWLDKLDPIRASKPSKRRRNLISMIVLTKCDRYADIDGFPSQLLIPRANGRQFREATAEQMYAEQGALYDFVVKYGGVALIDAAKRINGTVFFSAVSGTGSDVSGRPAAAHSAPNRSLDPVTLALMRLGLGDFNAEYED